MSESFKMQLALEDVKERLFTKNLLKPSKRFENFTFCEGAQKIFRLPNAGGNSVNSEALSLELLNSLYGATLEATEMELRYFPLGSKITDYSVKVQNQLLGVSVTRAMKFGNSNFSKGDAKRLLEKKLYGVNASTKAVLRKYRWKKQILHVFAEHKYIANILEDVYNNEIEEELKNNTIVIVTICENADWIFFEGKNM